MTTRPSAADKVRRALEQVRERAFLETLAASGLEAYPVGLAVVAETLHQIEGHEGAGLGCEECDPVARAWWAKRLSARYEPAYPPPGLPLPARPGATAPGEIDL
jgi:hypothetical protein